MSFGRFLAVVGEATRTQDQEIAARCLGLSYSAGGAVPVMVQVTWAVSYGGCRSSKKLIKELTSIVRKFWWTGIS